MQMPSPRLLQNPLAGLISDEDFRVLEAHQLLSRRGIRDYQMRLAFRQMRRERGRAAVAIERLKDVYPYLQVDTIRKIVYNTGTQR